MRGLFTQLNWQGIEIDISTFSKASKNRDPSDFQKVFASLNQELKQKNKRQNFALFPVDSTIKAPATQIITLTSKLLWLQGINQFKLFEGLNSLTSEIEGVSFGFGQGNDSKYGEETLAATPENAVLIMDRGFSSLERIQKLLQNKEHYFLLRVNQNVTLEEQENGFYQIGKQGQLIARCVIFFDEKGIEYRLVTNLSKEEENSFTDEDIKELYRQRW